MSIVLRAIQTLVTVFRWQSGQALLIFMTFETVARTLEIATLKEMLVNRWGVILG